jgi:hypothetical protein
METCSKNELKSNIKEDLCDKIKENKIVWSERWIGKDWNNLSLPEKDGGGRCLQSFYIYRRKIDSILLTRVCVCVCVCRERERERENICIV